MILCAFSSPVTQPERIYPYFDDIQQYAKHFRYRMTFKYSIKGGLHRKRRKHSESWVRIPQKELF